MASVRLLVGTKKGAFIMTSDGTRSKWKISKPHFAGYEMYHLKGSPVDPAYSAIRRRREDMGAGRQQVHVRWDPGHPSVV
jgi:hypothetical protein